MMVIIIGKNRVEYCRVKKKDLNKHFFVTRDQAYKVYPDALTPMEIYHNGAWVGSESVIVFEENGIEPYHCKYRGDYEKDTILASIDEHKLMANRKKIWFSNGGDMLKTILTNLPMIIIGFVILFAVVFQ